jgi:AcrR family transcriptional regulator
MESGDEPESLRERLVDAGVELVMSGGAAGLGLRQIARQARVSHGAPRRYFPTHRSLLSAIARRGFADLGARFTAATRPRQSPRAQLLALGRAYVTYAQEERGMFELMFRHDLLKDVPAPSGQPRLRESTMPLFERIVALIREHRAGTAPDQDDAVIAAALWANVHGIAQLWAWGSLQLALGTAPGRDVPFEGLITTAVDAHLESGRTRTTK